MKPTSSNNKISIDHTHFLDNIQSSIIQATKALQVERQCDIDNAIEVIRVNLMEKTNGLLKEEHKVLINEIREEVSKNIKSMKSTNLDRKVYKLLNIMGL